MISKKNLKKHLNRKKRSVLIIFSLLLALSSISCLAEGSSFLAQLKAKTGGGPAAATPSPMPEADPGPGGPSAGGPGTAGFDSAPNSEAPGSSKENQEQPEAAKGPGAAEKTAEKAKDEKADGVENVAQVERDWSEDSRERGQMTQNADEIYKKLTGLEQKSTESLDKLENDYENISQELNKTYNQGSSAMGRFVEVGRKIEGYVQQNMARYED